MHSICFRLGALTVHWYGVMMALGFLAGLANWMTLPNRGNRDFNYCSDLLFWIMLSGIVGARLAFVLAEWPQFAAAPATIIRVDQGGLVYYGGFIAAGVALLVFARRHGEQFLDLVDFVVTSVPVAHALGRVGCFMNGCCYGVPTNTILGVSFPGPGHFQPASLVWQDHLHAGLIQETAARSLPIHPVQLYETALNILLFLALRRVYRKRHWSGSVTVFYLICYAAIRFFTETLRGDRGQRIVWMSLSSAQWISLLLLVTAAAIYAFAKPRGTGAHADADR